MDSHSLTMSPSKLPKRVTPCTCTGEHDVDIESDGICTIYKCSECGDTLAELVMGAEV